MHAELAAVLVSLYHVTRANRVIAVDYAAEMKATECPSFR